MSIEKKATFFCVCKCKIGQKPLPWRCSYHNKLGEELWTSNGCQNTDHCRNRVTHIKAPVNAKSVKNVEQVIDIGFKISVASKIEIIRIDTTSTYKIKQNHPIVWCEERENALPSGLVGAKSMGKNQKFVTLAFDTDIESV